ncbi:hypothetical protein CG423_26775, partial [Shigella flexneri]
KQKKLIMLPSETMIWQPEFTDKTLSRKPGAVQCLQDNGLPPPEKGSVLLVPARWLNWNLKFCNCVRR